ncbi:MAG: sigma-54 dependent transcriptional regulator [Phycisphaerales bacterium]|jgi:DNA-binding NtrC family response regulator
MDVCVSSPAIRRLVGQSVVIRRVRDLISVVAGFPSSVLIRGESGTGKEIVARAVHECSTRHAAPFVPIDCTILTESLFESLLFGHEKGSFSGAVSSTTGLIRAADAGTVFLDEIGELPLPEQAKMLRLLQERTVLPVGTTRPLSVDIRVIAATHRDLPAMVRDGRFRADLLYRLDVVRIGTPSLRDCPEDIPLIAESVLAGLAHKLGICRTLSDDAMAAIVTHPWPGNVRQLAACLERGAILAQGLEIMPADLGLGHELTPPTPLLEKSTTNAVLTALSACRGNRAAAARQLGIDRRQLYRLMDRLNLREPLTSLS